MSNKNHTINTVRENGSTVNLTGVEFRNISVYVGDTQLEIDGRADVGCDLACDCDDISEVEFVRDIEIDAVRVDANGRPVKLSDKLKAKIVDSVIKTNGKNADTVCYWLEHPASAEYQRMHGDN